MKVVSHPHGGFVIEIEEGRRISYMGKDGCIVREKVNATPFPNFKEARNKQYVLGY